LIAVHDVQSAPGTGCVFVQQLPTDNASTRRVNLANALGAGAMIERLDELYDAHAASMRARGVERIGARDVT